MKRILFVGLILILFGVCFAQITEPNLPDPNIPPDPNAPPAFVIIRVQVAPEHIRAMRINGVTLQQLVNKEMQRQVVKAKEKLIRKRTLTELEAVKK